VFMGEGLPPVWAEAARATVHSEINAARQTRRDIGELTAQKQEDRQLFATGGKVDGWRTGDQIRGWESSSNIPQFIGFAIAGVDCSGWGEFTDHPMFEWLRAG